MKKLVVSIIILSMLLLNISIVNAATVSASLNSSSTSVKPGDTFTVTLSAKCEDGINGIDTTYSYDEDKLELKSENVANDKWANLGETGTIQAITHSTSKITSDDIFVLTFKVKDNIAVGTTAKISTSEINIDVDNLNDMVTESAKTLNINIASTTSNTSGSNGGSQGSSTVNSNNNSGTTNNSKESSNGVNNKNSSDKSTSGTALPKTGDTSIILVSLIILVSISSIVFYIKMKKQK